MSRAIHLLLPFLHCVIQGDLYLYKPVRVRHVTTLSWFRWCGYVLQGLVNLTKVLLFENQRNNYRENVKRWSSLYNRSWRPREVLEAKIYSFFDVRARWDWVVNGTPWPLYPGKQNRYPFYKNLGWLQGGLDGWGKFRPYRYSTLGPSCP